MSMGFFITENSPVIWRGPMVHGLIHQFLTDVEWGELDYLVVDMPPGTGDAALTLTQQAPLAGAVIVTTANDLSLIDARKGLKMFEKVQVPVLGIIENMSYFTPPDLPDRKYYLFGRGGGERVAAELSVPFLGEVPIDPRVVDGGDRGRPIPCTRRNPTRPVRSADRRQDRAAPSVSRRPRRRSPTRTSPGSRTLASHQQVGVEDRHGPIGSLSVALRCIAVKSGARVDARFGLEEAVGDRGPVSR
jgi:hypothetical protein